MQDRRLDPLLCLYQTHKFREVQKILSQAQVLTTS